MCNSKKKKCTGPKRPKHWNVLSDTGTFWGWGGGGGGGGHTNIPRGTPFPDILPDEPPPKKKKKKNNNNYFTMVDNVKLKFKMFLTLTLFDDGWLVNG